MNPSRTRKDFLYYPNDFEYRNRHILLRKYPGRRQQQRKQTNQPPPPSNNLNDVVSLIKTVITIVRLFLNVFLSKKFILFTISVYLGKEIGRSTASFCLSVLSLIGGSGYGQGHPFLVISVFLGGLYVGHNQVTWYIVILSWLVAYACHLHVKDVVIMTLAYWFGILANVSNHVLSVVVLSYLGGKAIQYDKTISFYLGLSFMRASWGRMTESLPLYTEFGNVMWY